VTISVRLHPSSAPIGAIRMPKTQPPALVAKCCERKQVATIHHPRKMRGRGGEAVGAFTHAP